jgi:glycerophosphoryl diester phosphodiesterase
VETKRKADDPEAIGDDFDGETPGLLEQEILRLVDAYGVKARVIVQSFDYRSLWAIRSVDDTIRLAALTSRERPQLADYAGKGADIWSPNYNALSPALVDAAHAAGLQVIPWTVNEAAAMRELLAMGVDGIISDRPDILLALE